MLFAGPRPEEVVAMDVGDVTLPEAGAADQWGELLFHMATPEVGRRWTDSGEIHDDRDLKGRAEGETQRPVPCHPVLTAILRDHIETNCLRPGALLFQGEHGGRLRRIGFSAGVGQGPERGPHGAPGRVATREAGVGPCGTRA